MENIQKFVEQLLQEQGVPEIDESARKQLVSDLSNRLIDFINRRLIDSMKEEDMKDFSKLLDEDPLDPKKVEDFVSDRVANKEQITLDAMIEFRSLYLGDKA